MVNIVYRHTSQDSFIQRSDYFFVIFDSSDSNPSQRTTILFCDCNIVGNIHQTTGQVTGICRFQSRIGQTFTGTVSWDKVLQHGQSLFEIRQNRILDNLTTGSTRFLRFRHQSTHTAQLTDLFTGTTGPGVKHHINRVESLIVFGQLFHQRIGQLGVHMRPDIDDLIVTFVVRDETHVIVVHDLFYLVISFL